MYYVVEKKKYSAEARLSSLARSYISDYLSFFIHIKLIEISITSFISPIFLLIYYKF